MQLAVFLDRRLFLGSAASLAALAACSPKGKSSDGLTVGFVYVGPKDDYGYNQAHAEGAAALKGIPGLKIVEEENVPETVAVQQTMESMIKLDGAKLIFPTSFGYFDPHMLKVAADNTAIQFRHCGGLWTDKNPPNTGSYFGYIGLCQYLNGVVAAHVTKSKKLGFVAAKPIPQVLLNINSFLLGARSVDPAITCQVIFTGEWSLAVKEAEAVNALIDAGADVLTCHVDSPKVVVQTAAGRGAYVCGYHANQSALAPDKYLTGAEWNWSVVYKSFVDQMMKGEALPHFVRGGLIENFVKMSPYGPAVPEAGRTAADAVKAVMMKGSFPLIKGPLKDNKGAVIAAAGVSYPETAVELEKMNYLVEGVIGSAT